jgi:hypothetical protein
MTAATSATGGLRMTKLTAPSTPQLDDEDAEICRREFERKIIELQGLPFASARVIASVTLADGVATAVPHGLGRVASFVSASVPRNAAGAGYIVEVRDGSVDRTKYLNLKASGYGATITVDLVVL